MLESIKKTSRYGNIDYMVRKENFENSWNCTFYQK